MPHIHAPTLAPMPTTLDEEATAVRGGPVSLADIERRLAPYFARAESRQRAMAYLRGLLGPAERKNSWQLAELSGEATPYGCQHLLGRADWEADAVRDALRRHLIQHLGEPDAVLVMDATGFVKKGRHSAGVARQYSGTAGRIDNCQIGVFLAYASPLGHALLDRELYLPRVWMEDPARCRQAGIPKDRRFATKPQLAREMLARALAAGGRAKWVTGDSVYGDDRRLRMQRQVNTILARLPEDGWTRLSAGNGTKGPRWDDWRWLPLAEPLEPGWCRWLLVRRSISDPRELQAYVVFAPQDIMLAEVVRVAGMRWAIESCFEAAKSEVGLDHYEVRSWTGWYRHITLAMWALALLTALRAGAVAVDTLKKSPPSSQERSSLAAFKATRGLTSH